MVSIDRKSYAKSVETLGKRVRVMVPVEWRLESTSTPTNNFDRQLQQSTSTNNFDKQLQQSTSTNKFDKQL